jgi:hypothetical protein
MSVPVAGIGDQFALACGSKPCARGQFMQRFIPL